VIDGDDTDHPRGVLAADDRQHAVAVSEAIEYDACRVIGMTVYQFGIDE
jgi:hypothetical protein